MITTSLPSGFATSQGVLADPVQRPVHQHEDVDGLMQEVVRVKARQHAMRLADEVVRSVVAPSDPARCTTAWRDLYRTIDRLQGTVASLESSALFDVGNPAGLPQELVLNLRDVAPGQLVSTVCAPCTALTAAVVQAAGRGDAAAFQRATHKLLFLSGRIKALGTLVEQLGTLAGRPANFARPGWFGRQPPGTYTPQLRDDIRQLLARLTPVQGALASPRGAVQLLLAFARASQTYPEDIAAIVRQHGAVRWWPRG